MILQIKFVKDVPQQANGTLFKKFVVMLKISSAILVLELVNGTQYLTNVALQLI